MLNREKSAGTEDGAAIWAARVDRGPLSDTEQAALDEWLAGDIRRVGAYAMARATLFRVGAVPGGEHVSDTETALHIPAFGWWDRIGLTRRRVMELSAVAIAIISIGIGAFFVDGRQTERHATAIGEVRRIPLADGSTVSLNTASVVEIRFGRNERLVTLLQGEALFDVASDPDRSFVVVAGSTDVRAVGTSFTVRRETDQIVDILVNEGVVEISQADVAAVPVRIGRNMQAQTNMRAGTPIMTTAISAADMARSLFWRQGKIGFSDTTLQQAAAEFARYSAVKIIIPDPQTAQQRITGLFTATDPAGFADAAAASLGLNARRRGDVIELVTPSHAHWKEAPAGDATSEPPGSR